MLTQGCRHNSSKSVRMMKSPKCVMANPRSNMNIAGIRPRSTHSRQATTARAKRIRSPDDSLNPTSTQSVVFVVSSLYVTQRISEANLQWL